MNDILNNLNPEFVRMFNDTFQGEKLKPIPFKEAPKPTPEIQRVTVPPISTEGAVKIDNGNAQIRDTFEDHREDLEELYEKSPYYPIEEMGRRGYPLNDGPIEPVFPEFDVLTMAGAFRPIASRVGSAARLVKNPKTFLVGGSEKKINNIKNFDRALFGTSEKSVASTYGPKAAEVHFDPELLKINEAPDINLNEVARQGRLKLYSGSAREREMLKKMGYEDIPTTNIGNSTHWSHLNHVWDTEKGEVVPVHEVREGNYRYNPIRKFNWGYGKLSNQELEEIYNSKASHGVDVDNVLPYYNTHALEHDFMKSPHNYDAIEMHNIIDTGPVRTSWDVQEQAMEPMKSWYIVHPKAKEKLIFTEPGKAPSARQLYEYIAPTKNIRWDKAIVAPGRHLINYIFSPRDYNQNQEDTYGRDE